MYKTRHLIIYKIKKQLSTRRHLKGKETFSNRFLYRLIIRFFVTFQLSILLTLNIIYCQANIQTMDYIQIINLRALLCIYIYIYLSLQYTVKVL